MLLLGVATVLIGGQIAKEGALEDARLRGATIADSIAGPLVDRRVRAGDPGASQELERAMRARMRDGTLSHVKLWSQDGTVVWSDEKALVGRSYPLDADVEELFGSSEVTANLSDLSDAENALERGESELLEVYAGAIDSDGQPFVFEAYMTTDRMRTYERRLVTQILPLSIGGLLLFEIAILPLAVSLARRVEKGEEERSRMLRHNLQVVEQERRHLAQDLHDGVIQDLAGLSFALPLVATYLPDDPQAAQARAVIERVSGTLQTDVAALRSMLTEIYPPDLAEPDGFRRAVEDLAQSLREQGTQVEVRIPDDHFVNLETRRLAYRVIREGLRNVHKHANAEHARVELRRDGSLVRVVVADDGVGLSTDRPVEDGHLGLTLLQDTLVDFGGVLTVAPDPGGGTVLVAAFPPLAIPQ